MWDNPRTLRLATTVLPAVVLVFALVVIVFFYGGFLIRKHSCEQVGGQMIGWVAGGSACIRPDAIIPPSRYLGGGRHVG